MFHIARLLLKVPRFYQKCQISTKKFDPILVEQLTKRIDDQKSFSNIDINNFEILYKDDCEKKNKLEKVIDIYDNMKYNLEDVPSTLTHSNLVELMELETNNDIKRLFRKLYRKEFEFLLRKELKNHNKLTTMVSDDSQADRTGIFDSSGNLHYGLWHNTLVTRIPKLNQTRFSLDRLRNVELFGQHLYLDFSFSKHLNYHLCLSVANDIGKMLSFNRYNMKNPFKIILCGIDYDHHLWKALSKVYKSTIELTSHTNMSYLELCSQKSSIIYITCLENQSFLEYDPNASYVMAAISEKDIQNNFLIPALQKLKIKRQGIPIDQHVLWQSGSKRLNLYTRLKILNDIQNSKGWKETLSDNIRSTNFKTEQQIIQEDYQRSLQLKTKTKKRK